MKIVIVTQEAPMYLAPCIEDFLNRISGSAHKVEAMAVFSPYFSNTLLQELKMRFQYYGALDFFRMSALVFKNKALSRANGLLPLRRCYSVKNIIKRFSIPEIKTNSPNSREFIDFLREKEIDLVISIAAPKLFKKELILTPKKGCINYHTALLPRYRGRVPLFWALLNDEKEVGVTIHQVDEGLDSGAIIAQDKVAVDKGDSLHSLYLKTIKVGPRLLAQAVDEIDAGPVRMLVNDSSRATQYGFPSKQDVRSFRRKGKKFF